MRQINLRRTFVFFGAWILIAFLFSGLLYFTKTQIKPDEPPEWQEVFLWQAIIYAWAILSPAIIIFAKRFRIEQKNWWRMLPVHLVMAIVFLILHTLILNVFFHLVDRELAAGDGNFHFHTVRLLVRNWTLDLPTYCFLLSLFYVVDFYRRFQAERIQSSELKAALAGVQLEALKMQLQPHFLFNALNSISALMHDDLRAADQMIARLGDFLRLTLHNSGDQEVSLRQEMDFVEGYLEIESVRFQDRLVVQKNVDPSALAARVPNLILQPIIENAINHGIARKTSAGRIIISAWRAEDKLQICVEDSGPGLSLHNGNRHGKTAGIGLANTRARLKHLYGENHHFEIKNAVPHGLIVMLEMPFNLKSESRSEREAIEKK